MAPDANRVAPPFARHGAGLARCQAPVHDQSDRHTVAAALWCGRLAQVSLGQGGSLASSARGSGGGMIALRALAVRTAGRAGGAMMFRRGTVDRTGPRLREQWTSGPLLDHRCERQAAYRKAMLTADENGERRINDRVTTGASFAPARLARHQGVTNLEMLERLITASDDTITAKVERKPRACNLD
jgi:hypothetical protein